MSCIEADLPTAATAADAFAHTCARHPKLNHAAQSTAFAVNRRHVGPGTVLCDGDEVSFLPPVAGG
ncbi:MAG: MoaD/ThiS family protein [Candidatus Eremiobacteraeota bacterium]|nr:MoaD/ThiS family protein [Candidatus Eremiobacteraeota bacterium]